MRGRAHFGERVSAHTVRTPVHACGEGGARRVRSCQVCRNRGMCVSTSLRMAVASAMVYSHSSCPQQTGIHWNSHRLASTHRSSSTVAEHIGYVHPRARPRPNGNRSRRARSRCAAHDRRRMGARPHSLADVDDRVLHREKSYWIHERTHC